MDASSSTSSSKHKPLHTFWVLVVLVAASLGLEWTVSRYYSEPSHLLDLVSAYEKSAPTLGPHVVSFGTCLGDAMVPRDVEENWGAGIKVVKLASRASTSLDWYLILKHRLLANDSLKAAIVAFGADDLRLKASPWESSVMNLAKWQDLRTLIQVNCDSPSCTAEMILRKASRAYRVRGFLGNAFWAALGTYPPGPKLARPKGVGPANQDGTAIPVPVDMRSPVGPGGPRARGGPGSGFGRAPGSPGQGSQGLPPAGPRGFTSPGNPRQGPQGPPPNGPPPAGAPPAGQGPQGPPPNGWGANGPQGGAQALGPGRQGGGMGANDAPALLYPGNLPDQTAPAPQGIDLGWRSESSWVSSKRDPYVWVKMMLAEARERRIRLIFMPMPGNPARRKELKGWYEPERRAEIKRIIAAGGGVLLDPGEIKGLSAQHYIDEVHYTDFGARFIAAALGRTLRDYFATIEE